LRGPPPAPRRSCLPLHSTAPTASSRTERDLPKEAGRCWCETAAGGRFIGEPHFGRRRLEHDIDVRVDRIRHGASACLPLAACAPAPSEQRRERALQLGREPTGEGWLAKQGWFWLAGPLNRKLRGLILWVKFLPLRQPNARRIHERMQPREQEDPPMVKSSSSAFFAAFLLVIALGGGGCGGDDGGPEGQGGQMAAGGSGGEGVGGSGGTGTNTGGTGGGNGGSGGDENGGTNQQGDQGIFATLNGESLAATIGSGSGYVTDASLEPGGGYSHVVATAKEDVDGDRVTWTLWFPRATGTYACGLHTDGEDIAFIDIENTGTRSGASSGISAEGCSLEVTHFDPDGIIAGTFSGILGGFLGQDQTVSEGRFHFDNSRGGGDCSLASDPGIPEGEFGATVAIKRLELDEAQRDRAPKYLRCGQNLRLEADRSWDMNINLGGGRADMAPSIAFNSPNVFYGIVSISLQLSGIDRSRDENENCAFGVFQGFRSDRPGEGVKCRLSLSTFDDELREGTYEATMALDGNLIEIGGSFRIPSVFPVK